MGKRAWGTIGVGGEEGLDLGAEDLLARAHVAALSMPTVPVPSTRTESMCMQ